MKNLNCACRLCTALTLALLSASPALAQNLLDLLNEGVVEETRPVEATFKDTRIVNVQSNETPAQGVMHFVIAHRFGTLNSGIYELWGLDNAQMRMALDYGLNDRLAVGVARNTYQKTYEVNVKARVLQQTTGPEAFPVSVTWYSVAMANGLRPSEGMAQRRSALLFLATYMASGRSLAARAIPW